jgi:hypothetical protein
VHVLDLIVESEIVRDFEPPALAGDVSGQSGDRLLDRGCGPTSRRSRVDPGPKRSFEIAQRLLGGVCAA